MLQVAVIVISSKIVSGTEEDTGRAALEQMMGEIPGRMAIYEVVPDDRRAVAERLATVADAGQTDVVLTVGGTGVRPTDWVPESKPIWFTELGAPAIHRGANQSNVFLDPKSSESFAP